MCRTYLVFGDRQQEAVVEFAKVGRYHHGRGHRIQHEYGTRVFAVVVVGRRIHGQRTGQFCRLDVHRVVDGRVETQHIACKKRANVSSTIVTGMLHLACVLL